MCVYIPPLIVHFVLTVFRPQHNVTQYDVWGSLARDFLPIMVSSVASKRIFHSAGVKTGKHHSELDPDLFEALPFFRCVYHPELLFHEEFVMECKAKEFERNLDVQAAARIPHSARQISLDGLVDGRQ